jgi:hypothetical protein
MNRPRAVPCDYDSDPGRFAASLSFRPPDGDLFAPLVRRLAAEPAVSAIFQVSDTIRWDGPLIELADHGDVQRYLRGRGLPPSQLGAAARQVSTRCGSPSGAC